jgi:hypothetical protein
MVNKPRISWFFHFLATGELMAHLKHLSVNPSGDSPKGFHQGCMAQYVRLQLLQGIKSEDSSVLRQCYMTVRHLSIVHLSICFKLLASFVIHLTIINTIYCSAYVLIILCYWPLWMPEKQSAALCLLLVESELSSDMWLSMFSFHTLVCNIWIVIVDPCFIHTYDATQK